MTSFTTLKSKYPGAESFTFGDNADLCRHLISLVREGRKTATCGALADFEAEGEPLPVMGRSDIALNWDDTPALVIRTTKVTQIRFCDVTEDMALAEGENDSLAGWQRDHQAFFERNSGFTPEMMLVFEHFELIEVLG